MAAFFLRRFLSGVLTLFVIASLSFAITRLAPGNPFSAEKKLSKEAEENAPSIIFIDEIDAIAAQRIEIGTSGEREVQRTFMQLLAEIDGFNHLGNVKVIGCTNRKDIMDPAILRPGRLDRLIYVPNPDQDGIKEIFKIHSRNMKFEKTVDVAKLNKLMEGFSGAEVRAVCTEAGYFAIRDNCTKIRITADGKLKPCLVQRQACEVRHGDS